MRLKLSSAGGSVGLLVLATACALPIPRAGGAPIAPSAPDRPWRPPAAAVDANAGAPSVPIELPAQRGPLTLPEIVSLALRNNPATRESWAQAQMAAYAYGSARGAYFPSIDASVTGSRTAQPTGTSSITATGTSIAGTRSLLTQSLSLTYTVLDFGVRSGTVAAARETAYALGFTHNATLQSTVLNAEQSFYTYAGARAVLDAALLSVREAQASYQAAWKKDSLGLATIADVLQARTALAQARLALDTAQAAVQTSRATLAVAFGAPATLQFDVAASLDSVNVGDVALSVESLVDEAMRRRPDLQSALAYVRAAQADVRVARGNLLPTLGLTASTGYTNSTISQLTGRSNAVSLGVSIPVFHGFSYWYDLARARADVQYQAAFADAVRQSIGANVVTAYYQVRSATDVVRTSDELLESASAAMRAVRARYDAGLASLIDLLTAQASLATARTQVARARWSWASQLAGLAYAAGALDDRGATGIPATTAPR